MNDSISFEQFKHDSGDMPVELKHLLQQAIALDKIVEELEKKLKEAKQARTEMLHETLPTAMAEAQLNEAKLDNGTSVKIKEYIAGTLPKEPEQRDTAIDWLSKNGFESIIKSTVKVEFGRGEYKDSLKLTQALEENSYRPDLSTGVHPQTLYAAARDLLRNGRNIPSDLLGLYIGRVAKIKGVGQ